MEPRHIRDQKITQVYKDKFGDLTYRCKVKASDYDSEDEAFLRHAWESGDGVDATLKQGIDSNEAF